MFMMLKVLLQYSFAPLEIALSTTFAVMTPQTFTVATLVIFIDSQW